MEYILTLKTNKKEIKIVYVEGEVFPFQTRENEDNGSNIRSKSIKNCIRDAKKFKFFNAKRNEVEIVNINPKYIKEV